MLYVEWTQGVPKIICHAFTDSPLRGLGRFQGQKCQATEGQERAMCARGYASKILFERVPLEIHVRT